MSATIEVICKMAKVSKQCSVRFDDSLPEWIEQMAKANDRTLSQEVVHHMRQARARHATAQAQPSSAARLAPSQQHAVA
jgi:hemerythrin